MPYCEHNFPVLCTLQHWHLGAYKVISYISKIIINHQLSFFLAAGLQDEQLKKILKQHEKELEKLQSQQEEDRAEQELNMKVGTKCLSRFPIILFWINFLFELS